MTHRQFTPSPAQQAYFDWIDAAPSQHATLIAVAGAGKTTTLIQGLSRMTGDVAFLAYNAKIVGDIKAKIGFRRGVFPQTFHSAGRKALQYAYGRSHALEVDGKKVEKIVRQMVLEKGAGEDDLIACVVGMVSMAKQRGLGVPEIADLKDDDAWLAMIDQFALDEALPEGRENQLITALRYSQEALRRSSMDLGSIDFDDMVYLPLQRGLRLLGNDWVLVDEAQDLNPTRRLMAQRMLKPRGRLVAVGDPSQAIYGFTGCDNDSLDILTRELNATVLPLTVTYRCPKAVVEVARQWVDHITAHDSAPDGVVGSYDFKDASTHLMEVGDAVLCRFNKYLVGTAFKLIKSGKAAKIEGRDIAAGLIKLATRWKSAKTLNALSGRLEEWLERELAKAKAKDDDARAERAQDTVDTLAILIERARELGGSQVSDLVAVIYDLFGDTEKGEMKDCVVLCSIHKSKGLEWSRVHVLGLYELNPRTSRDWQAKQEANLKYVAVTRAMDTLFVVSGVQEPKARGTFGGANGY